jgi:tetratricopeptide (TPR) repeat protein
MLLLLAGRVSAQPQKSADEHNEQARAYYRTASYVLAAQEFRKAYLIDKDAARLFNAGLAYEKAQMLDEARAAFVEYLEVAPKGDRAVEARARNEALDRQQQGQVVANRAEQLQSEVQALAAKAKTLQEKGNHVDAAAIFQSAYEKSNQKQFLFKRADALRLGGRTMEAISGSQ